MPSESPVTPAPPRHPAAPDRLVGTDVGRYRIVGFLGSGGMGAVYLATHKRLGGEVAVKVVHAHIATDVDVVARFETEARTIARLEHTNIVRAFDFGVLHDGRPYFVMERLRGIPLHHAIANAGTLDVAAALHVTRELAAAMAAAHEAGVIHRDLKPSNVFLIEEVGGARPRVKVLDFGLAKLWREPPGERLSQEAVSHAGTVLGTPEYVSPERARGDPADARSDLYAIGIILWECLVGRPPFIGRPGDVLASQLRDSVPDIRTLRHGLPEDVATLVRALLEKNPARRPQTAHALIQFADRARIQPGLPPAVAGPPPVVRRPASRPPPQAARRPATVPPPAPARAPAQAAASTSALGAPTLAAAVVPPGVSAALASGEGSSTASGASPSRSGASKLPPVARKRILVVEDDVVNSRVLFDYFTAHGYDVTTARTGSEGLEAWQRDRPDLMVVDVLLPVKNGFELCLEVRNSPAARRTPVILMSAVYKHPERDPAYAHRVVGADAYLCKPFELRDMLERVQALLGEQ